MQAEQWKTTIDLSHMNLIIFPRLSMPYLSVQAQQINCGLPWFSLLVARLLQSVYFKSTTSNGAAINPMLQNHPLKAQREPCTFG